jgi:hypothetical protein
MKALVWLLVTVFSFLFSEPALAQEAQPVSPAYPLADLHRLDIGVRGEYAFWNAANGTPAPAFAKEWGVGLVASYQLVPNLALVGGLIRGLDTKLTRSYVGLNLHVFNGAAWRH